ncbi:Uncharacterized protein FKW44_015500 [Caligus rogercresseyi]|uniref:DUF659 domain-containing protein n=1 Tax=Caligus rogercresseyi TaxID=217165 RepID=A0A7T8H0K3_CALRO|nr:Uncharacterized protein FKW44_015500 [Caligus rogercresseyi]
MLPPYYLKAGRGLQNMLPNLIHVTCLCHGLIRVVEFVREDFSPCEPIGLRG